VSAAEELSAGKPTHFLEEVQMITLASLVRLAELLAAPARGAVQGVVALTRSLRHRADVRRLTLLSDHQLKDVGLTRGEVAGALAVGWTEDPSCTLSARNAERSGLVALHRRSEDRPVPVRKAEVSAADVARLSAACCSP
jgi:uncharacterized protein YjiS (DUF1127 family)